MIKHLNQPKRTNFISLVTLLAMAVFSVSVMSPKVTAQVRSADDAAIQQSLEEEGVDERPERLDIGETTTYGLESSSGFVDENGDPISQEEWERTRQRQEEGLIRQPEFYIPALLIGVSAISYFAFRKIRK